METAGTRSLVFYCMLLNLDLQFLIITPIFFIYFFTFSAHQVSDLHKNQSQLETDYEQFINNL